MLLLSRAQGESVLVGDSTRVQVMSIKDGEVVLGFQAPREVKVLREEIAAKMRSRDKEPQS